LTKSEWIIHLRGAKCKEIETGMDPPTGLGRRIIAGEIRDGSAVEIGAEKGPLAFRVTNPETAEAQAPARG